MKTLKYLFLLSILFFNQNIMASDPLLREDPLSVLAFKQQAAIPFFGHRGYTDQQLTKIARIICKNNESIPILDEGPSPLETPDFGYSFPMLYIPSITAIVEIIARTNLGHTPVCYDIGSGHGCTSLYMVLAGGRVHSIERNKGLAGKVHKKTYTTLKNIALDRDQKREMFNRLTMARGDARDLTSTKLYPPEHSIDIVYMGAFLHFLLPAEIVPYLRGLREKMAPNGIVSATVHTPGKRTVDCFFEQKAAGDLFPGHAIRGNNRYPSRPAGPGDRPGYTAPIATAGPIIHYGRVIHCFDIDTFRRCFTEAGFEVELKYLNKRGQPVDDELGPEDFSREDYMVWALAKNTPPHIPRNL